MPCSHTNYGCDFCFRLEASSSDWEFPNLVVCRFYAGALFCILILWAFWHSFACLHLRSLRLSVSDGFRAIILGSCMSQLSFFAHNCFREVLACNWSYLCLQWKGVSEQLNRLRGRKTFDLQTCHAERVFEILESTPSTRHPNSKNAGLWKVFCSKPLTMLDILGFLFCVGHTKCWIFQGFFRAWTCGFSIREG